MIGTIFVEVASAIGGWYLSGLSRQVRHGEKIMKRCLQLIGLVAVLALTLVTSVSGPAWALNPCSFVHGKACGPNGKTTTCSWGGGETGVCTCTNGFWRCLL